MPSADQIAVVIAAAAREMGVSPVEVVTVLSPHRIKQTHYQAIARARYYAAHALRRAYSLKDISAAMMVGIHPHTAPSWFGAVDKYRAGWWDEALAQRVIDAAPPPFRPEPPPAEAIPTPSDALPTPITTKPISSRQTLEILPRPERASQHGLDRFTVSRRPETAVGGSMQLNRRASERRSLQDMLAEAAANTRAMQDRMNAQGKKPQTED